MPEDLATHTFATRARVHARATTAELLARAQDVALDPSIFDEHPPFFWQAAISNNQLDAYYTYMDAETTLRNYASDAASGVAFLAAHNARTLPFGQSLTGMYLPAGDVVEVRADFYTIPGLPLDVSAWSSGSPRTTEQLIVAIKAGIQRDVSVGFYGGHFRCNVCGNDLMDWRACTHFPGLTYEVKGPDGVVREVLATATVIDAHLAEVSAVYDGATPGAVILKAQDAAETGRINHHEQRALESRFAIRLPDRRLLVPGAITTEARMPPEQEPAAVVPAAEPTPVEARDAESGAALDAALLPIVQRAAPPAELDIRAAVEWLVNEVIRLRPLADDGRTYREDLIGQALAEGVRALGSGFSEETYRGILAAAPLDTIKRMRDDWKAVGDARFPGGRVTVDAAEPAPAPTYEVPAAAFRG